MSDLTEAQKQAREVADLLRGRCQNFSGITSWVVSPWSEPWPGTLWARANSSAANRGIIRRRIDGAFDWTVWPGWRGGRVTEGLAQSLEEAKADADKALLKNGYALL